MSVNTVPFQRTDISMQPLGPVPTKIFKANTTEPTNMTGSNPTELVDILAVLPGGIIKSNLSWIPPNPHQSYSINYVLT
jgi:hypothetical protein